MPRTPRMDENKLRRTGTSFVPQQVREGPSGQTTNVRKQCQSQLETTEYLLRERVRAKIEAQLRLRHPQRQDWQAKCPVMSVQLEKVLYKTANSLDEYSDETTITSRLAAIAMAKRENPVACAHFEYTRYARIEKVLIKAKCSSLSSQDLSMLFDISVQFPPTSELCTFQGPTESVAQLGGKVFHLWAHALRDGHIWTSEPVPSNSKFMFAGVPIGEIVDSAPRGNNPCIWVIRARNQAKTLERRVYSHSDHLGYVLVHYAVLEPLSTDLTENSHLPNCLCLECRLRLHLRGQPQDYHRPATQTIPFIPEPVAWPPFPYGPMAPLPILSAPPVLLNVNSSIPLITPDAYISREPGSLGIQFSTEGLTQVLPQPYCDGLPSPNLRSTPINQDSGNPKRTKYMS